MPDVFKILKDLELKAVGLDPATNKIQAGYFVAFRSVGLPIHKEDYSHPYSPLGALPITPTPATPPVDPATTAANPPTTSSTLDDKTNLLASLAQAQQNYVNTFMLLDDKLKMNSLYGVMPGSSKVSDSWFAIVNGANGIPPAGGVSDAIKQAIAAAQAKLQTPSGDITPHYQAYMNFEEEYKDKVKALNRAYAAAFTDPAKLATFPVVGVTYQDDVTEALQRWNGLGFMQEIEQALATLAAQGTDPSILLIARAKQKFLSSLLEFVGIGELPYTLMSPPSWWDADNDDGWNEYSSTDFHSSGSSDSSSTSYSAGGGFNAGFWSASADINHTDAQQSMNIHMDNLDVKFSYSVVDIKRPWLDTTLLNLPNWFLVGDYKKNCISDGTFSQEVPAGGVTPPTFLPSLTTSLVLIKDLSIYWSDWQNQWSAHQETTSASVSVGWGPFAVHGNYQHGSQHREFSADASGERLEVPGIQIIGYVSQINPASPAKDSAPYMSNPGH